MKNFEKLNNGQRSSQQQKNKGHGGKYVMKLVFGGLIAI